MKVFKSSSTRRPKSQSTLSPTHLSSPRPTVVLPTKTKLILTADPTPSSGTTSCSSSCSSSLSDKQYLPTSPAVTEPSHVNPTTYLLKILASRGYDTTPVTGLLSPYRILPTPTQMGWYDHPVLNAIRNTNLAALSQLQQLGASMEACNQYCESILHFAARKSSLEMVQFMLSNGARCFVDDAGRLPMHDVCWRARPAFDIVTLLLNHDISMLLVKDRFGAFPLDYVNPRQWKEWCGFLDSIKDQYWPVQSPSLPVYILA